MNSIKVAFVLIVFTAFFFHLSVAKRPKWTDLKNYSFEQYLLDFAKTYKGEEFLRRKEIFERNLDDVRGHNADDSRSWKKGINRMSDWAKEEFTRLLGYRKKQGAREESFSIPEYYERLPSHVDWRTKGVVTPVKNQGACGSCWTFGTCETIESFWALKTKKLVVMSEQQILDCTPNPNDCGGTGGCGGGTPEIAYQRIIQMGGLTSESNYPYTATDGNCQFNNQTINPVAKLSGYKVLPSNNYTAVLTAVAVTGPLVINVDASEWSSYDSGVFSGCDEESNIDIDHVVQLVGYGTDSQLGDYWIVRNSWGDWGESGYIRLARTAKVTCGVDSSPQDGTGCNGGPSQVTVCGECGILYDVSYPVV